MAPKLFSESTYAPTATVSVATSRNWAPKMLWKSAVDGALSWFSTAVLRASQAKPVRSSRPTLSELLLEPLSESALLGLERLSGSAPDAEPPPLHAYTMKPTI